MIRGKVTSLAPGRVRVDPALRCIASNRHLFDEGVTTRQFDSSRAQWWLEVLECARCGVVRVARYWPQTPLEREGAFRYIRPVEYRTLLEEYSASDARVVIFKAMWTDNGKQIIDLIA